MPEAMKKVKDELGEEAVILNSRVIYSGGFLGFFKRKSIEVVAALDESMRIQTPVIKNKHRKTPNVSNSVVKKNVVETRTYPTESEIMTEIAELKKTLQKNLPAYQHLAHYPEVVQEVLNHLFDHEVDEQFITEIGDLLLEKWRVSPQPLTAKDLKKVAKAEIQKQLSHIDFSGLSYEKKFIALVGPTGVGKTTTLAKLAAHAALIDKKKIGFITLDTYRIAAIEQLKTYAQLLHVPVEVAYEPEGFLHASEKLADCDVIFIDTAGRNYRQIQFITDLKKLLSSESELETYLVLSVSMKEKDMKQISENFKEMEISQFVFTKMDETNTYGAVVNVMLENKIGAAYLTTGQDVPDDIIAATPKVISDYLLGADLT